MLRFIELRCMKRAFQLYRFINIISLDVAMGAVTGAAFFGSIFKTTLLPQGLAALGLTVWIIYSVDHLLDAYKLKSVAASERHQFHQRHFRLIAFIVVLAALTDITLILYVRPSVLNAGFLLAGVVAFYLLFHRWMYPLKEIAGAILYSGGVWLPVLALHQEPVEDPAAYLMLPFFTTALINLILFSWFGYAQDVRDGHLSLVVFIGKATARWVLIGLFVMQFISLISLMVFTTYRIETGVILTMNIVLLLMLLLPDFFDRNDLYRVTGDVIFLFPLPYLFFHV